MYVYIYIYFKYKCIYTHTIYICIWVGGATGNSIYTYIYIYIHICIHTKTAEQQEQGLKRAEILKSHHADEDTITKIYGADFQNLHTHRWRGGSTSRVSKCKYISSTDIYIVFLSARVSKRKCIFTKTSSTDIYIVFFYYIKIHLRFETLHRYLYSRDQLHRYLYSIFVSAVTPEKSSEVTAPIKIPY